MKKSILSLFLSFFCLTSIFAQDFVIISEMCDPKSNFLNDRFVEIYNTGTSDVDLTGWTLVAIGNGADIFTWDLEGSIGPGEALVAGNVPTVAVFTVNFPDAGWYSNNGTWNGGNVDGAKLINSSNQIVDYAVGISFADKDMVRKATVVAPSTTFNADEWATSTCNAATDGSPGTHNGAVIDIDPIITQINITPARPTSEDTVIVSATITTTSSIVSATLYWDTSAVALNNTIAMVLQTANTYATSNAIPAHPQGKTIYYAITAISTEDTNSSAVKNYSIPVILPDTDPPAITDIYVLDNTNILVSFSEKIIPATATVATNYVINGNASLSAQIKESQKQVTLSTLPLQYGTHQLIIKNVEDLVGNAITSDTVSFSFLTSDIPDGYYSSAMGLVGNTLRQALHDIIDEHTVKSYDGVWTAYYTTDVKPNGKVWDIYSDIPGETPPYEYDFGVDQGGTGGGEGHGYTREHSFPKSWFGGTVSPMYTDIFALYPCDAQVNGLRGNNPYGEVDNPDVITLNGGRKGNNSYPGDYTGKAFEPIDAYKGDLARTYFYMITRYFGEDASWPGSPMVDGANLRPWALQMMMEWHSSDPVSNKEINRNEAIYAIQQNRNPFIDHPEWVNLIWGDTTLSAIEQSNTFSASAYMDYRANVLHFTGDNIEQVQVYNTLGRLMYNSYSTKQVNVSSWRSGVYIVRLVGGKGISTKKIIIGL
ncbi:MAG: endonuclease [Bacteroidales bacterium]|jgi:endonuclease I|nr:endonuclease [Bacteroidales bacterium]